MVARAQSARNPTTLTARTPRPGCRRRSWREPPVPAGSETGAGSGANSTVPSTGSGLGTGRRGAPSRPATDRASGLRRRRCGRRRRFVVHARCRLDARLGAGRSALERGRLAARGRARAAPGPRRRRRRPRPRRRSRRRLRPPWPAPRRQRRRAATAPWETAASPAAAPAAEASRDPARASWTRSSSERRSGRAGASAAAAPRRRPVGAQRRPAARAGPQVLAQRRGLAPRWPRRRRRRRAAAAARAQRPPSSLRGENSRKRSRPSARQRLILVRLKPVISPISAYE